MQNISRTNNKNQMTEFFNYTAAVLIGFVLGIMADEIMRGFLE